jgi:hypothetical protein
MEFGVLGVAGVVSGFSRTSWELIQEGLHA